MSGITQCPQCSTRFKVTPAQLDAHKGLVRCGRCHHVFDARPQFHNKTSSTPLAIPPTPNPVKVVPLPEPVVETQPSPAASIVATSRPEKSRGWFWRMGVAASLLFLLMQTVYFLRVELAARLPGLSPALVAYCDLLGCIVSLPQREDLMSIESSDLAASPTQASLITVNALLLNRAPYVQALPHLQLTLTDGQNKPLARRSFSPAEYMRSGADVQSGLAAGRELDVGLHLDTTDLNPVGYRLLLFYPPR